MHSSLEGNGVCHSLSVRDLRFGNSLEKERRTFKFPPQDIWMQRNFVSIPLSKSMQSSNHKYFLCFSRSEKQREKQRVPWESFFTSFSQAKGSFFASSPLSDSCPHKEKTCQLHFPSFSFNDSKNRASQAEIKEENCAPGLLFMENISSFTFTAETFEKRVPGMNRVTHKNSFRTQSWSQVNRI